MGVKLKPVSWAQYLGQKMYHIADSGQINEQPIHTPAGQRQIWTCTACNQTWNRDVVVAWQPHEFMRRFGIEDHEIPDDKTYELWEIRVGDKVFKSLIPAGGKIVPDGWRRVRGIV